jgi:hypothetical protein
LPYSSIPWLQDEEDKGAGSPDIESPSRSKNEEDKGAGFPDIELPYSNSQSKVTE